MKKKIVLLLTLIMVLAISACGKSADKASNKAENTGKNENGQVIIKVGYHYSSPYEVALAIAKEKGFFDEAFKDDNVKIEYIGFAGAGPAINEAFLADEINVAHGLGDQPCLSGIANGNESVIVSRIVKNTKGTGIIVKYDSDIQSVSELKGKTIAVGIGTAGQKNLDLLLEDYGLTESDVKLVNLQKYDEIVAAFDKGEIDAALNSSMAYTEEDDMQNKLFRTLIDLTTHPNFAYLEFKKDFLESNPEVSYKFVEALYKAIAWYYDGNVEEGDELTAKFLEQTEADEKNIVVKGNASMELNLDFDDEDVQNLQDTYDFLKRNDILPDEIDDLTTTYDSSIIEKVIANNK